MLSLRSAIEHEINVVRTKIEFLNSRNMDVSEKLKQRTLDLTLKLIRVRKGKVK